MPNLDIDSAARGIFDHISFIEGYLKKVSSDEQLQLQLQLQVISAHYLVVAAYGIIESQMKTMINNYVTKNSDENIARAMKRAISKEYAWHFDGIKKNLQNFNDSWEKQVKERVTEEQKKSITSLKKNTR